MRILLTGASSHSGFWFAQELVRGGHEVVALFTRPRDEYEGLRSRRVERLAPLVQPIFSCAFGSDSMLRLIREVGEWDLLCHHGADVRHYKSDDFDPVAALQCNTRNIDGVLSALRERGCGRIVLTGTYFEQDEGLSSEEERGAFSPYGLSKGLTSQMFRFYAAKRHMQFAKFVMPNPFGPWEEGRFTSYLASCWLQGRTPLVASPDYVRDNIPVDLLAKAYAEFCIRPGSSVYRPSGFVESQGAFAKRFSAELEPRLQLPCPLAMQEQLLFKEPKIRINADPVAGAAHGWRASLFWDALAAYYEEAASLIL